MWVFLLGRGVGIPVINILEFHLSTVPGSQTDLVLHPRMEDERSTTKINATDVCLRTLDFPGLRVNLVLKSEKMPCYCPVGLVLGASVGSPLSSSIGTVNFPTHIEKLLNFIPQDEHKLLPETPQETRIIYPKWVYNRLGLSFID